MSRAPGGFGVVLRDIPSPVPLDSLSAALDAVVRAGADALQVPSVAWLSAALDDAELRAAGESAASRGVELTASLGTLNACWPERMTALAALGDGDASVGVERSVRAAAAAGISALHVTCGQLDDREAEAPSWSEQLERNGELVARAASDASAAGVALVLKTHEEMSSWEAVRIAEASGGTLRLGFSPVNLLVGMEEPVAAAARVAHLTHTVFVDDAALVRSPVGLHRSMQAVGDGVIRWRAVFAALAQSRGDVTPTPRVTLDLHRAIFDIALFDDAWSPAHPDVSVDEVSGLLGRALDVTPADAAPDDRFARGVDAIGHLLADQRMGATR